MSCNYAEGLSPYENKGKLGIAEKFDEEGEIEDKVERLAQWIREARHIVLHTGAGISTSAGIPDFRGPKGVWTLEEKGLKPEINVSWNDAKPTTTHMAIARLVELGIVKFVVTQNIDGLHLRSGVPRKNLAELHGNMFVDQCDKCKKMIVRDSPSPTVGQKYTGLDCPAYKENGRKCRGKLKDFVLDWEDGLPDDDLTISDTHSMMADLSIVMGSTLQIIPAGNMPLYAKKYQTGGKLVICNLQPTKHYAKADLNIHTYVDDIMTKLFEKLGLTIPEFQADQDPVRQVRGGSLPEHGYIDWTQCPVLARDLKKRGDDIHDEYLKIRREEKKRKGTEVQKKTKLVKLEEKTLVKSEPIVSQRKERKPKVVKRQKVTEVIDIDCDDDFAKVESIDTKYEEVKCEEVNVKDDDSDSDIEVISEFTSVKEVTQISSNGDRVSIDALKTSLKCRENGEQEKDLKEGSLVYEVTSTKTSIEDSAGVSEVTSSLQISQCQDSMMVSSKNFEKPEPQVVPLSSSSSDQDFDDEEEIQEIIQITPEIESVT